MEKDSTPLRNELRVTMEMSFQLNGHRIDDLARPSQAEALPPMRLFDKRQSGASVGLAR